MYYTNEFEAKYCRYLEFKKLKYIIENINKENNGNGRGLDLGCGDGSISILLSEQGYQMVGVDIAKDKILIAESRKKDINNPEFYELDANSMQLEKNSFDFVVFSEVMMHIQNPEEVLISINETLKENGILVFTAINLNGPYSLLYHHFRNNVITKIFRSIPPSGHNTFTLQNYVALFRKTKFEILNITHSNFISFLPIIVK